MSATTIDPLRLQAALAKARQALLDARAPAGHWEGELSSSALSTATAVCALALYQHHAASASPFSISHLPSPIHSGLAWLAAHVNPDGGWGDTVLSLSNISTTALCWAAFGAVPGADKQYHDVVAGAEKWLAQQAGGLEPDKLADAIIARYGKDRTFSVPILTMCALSGRFGTGQEAWRRVIPLPFELAAFPQKFFAALRLPVVSYALPALIAIGQVRHHHLPTRNPLTRLARNLARAKTLRVLTNIQPSSGGFLEATPLTSFVVMSLAGSDNANHPVALKGVEFLLKSVRPDGSWPIDTNLATWVTTLAVNALGPSIHEVMSGEERARILDWLLAQQYRTVHPYTNAPPGGWAWTDLPGGVPDADDTAGALLALRQLNDGSPRVLEAATVGVTWLLDLQNSDGGIPTFCRGWTNLPFDRSGPDLTAHALRAWLAWCDEFSQPLQARIIDAANRAIHFLTRSQRPDGSWVPLWFGNQSAPAEENPTYGTSRVLIALINASKFRLEPEKSRMRCQLNLSAQAQYKATHWLLKAHRPDGSWGGSLDGSSSIEETALTLEALTTLFQPENPMLSEFELIVEAVARGINWLVNHVEEGAWTQPAPIGFYFAKLWYFEKLYPQVFAVAALARASRTQSHSVASRALFSGLGGTSNALISPSSILPSPSSPSPE